MERSAVARGWREGKERTDRAQGIFRAMKLFCVYFIILCGPCHYVFVTTHRIYTKHEPSVKYRLQVMLMHQCRFVNCNISNQFLKLISSEADFL